MKTMNVFILDNTARVRVSKPSKRKRITRYYTNITWTLTVYTSKLLMICEIVASRATYCGVYWLLSNL
jgi:hypothetical protein